ncbi:GFA family protein [Moritella sp. 36]|uniref:GFA family protein n=1 Tax=Moritella sp. 36 TaxID=2746233 RepID=UPI001BADAF19|nr:GFA family protein [Moritella sp. 36]QUM88140.1 GFA family protein [Moritella sp. 36]
MIIGSCLCGRIQYQYDGSIDEVAVCHCNKCKKAQGGPFATNAPIKFKQLTFISGCHLLKTFFSSENKKRVFCSNCGSLLYSQRTDIPETIRLRLGTVTEGYIPEPNYEIFCESKSGWFSAYPERVRYKKNKI